MEKPTISIIMNCYNGEKFINKSINSVIAQSYLDWELIFWDNNSSDNSKKIFDQYIDDRLRYFKSKKTIILHSARKKAIEQANGKYIAFLDVDDWWDTKKLESQISLFDDPEIGLACTNYWRVKGNNIDQKKLVFKQKIPTGRILNDLLKKNYIGMSTLIIRRSSYDSLDYGFDDNLEVIGDYDLCLRLLVKWKLGVIQEPLSYYRWHNENVSNKKIEVNISELYKWHKKMKNFTPISSCKNFNCILNTAIYMETKINLLNKKSVLIFLSALKIKDISLILKLIIFFVTPKKIMDIYYRKNNL